MHRVSSPPRNRPARSRRAQEPMLLACPSVSNRHYRRGLDPGWSSAAARRRLLGPLTRPALSRVEVASERRGVEAASSPLAGRAVELTPMPRRIPPTAAVDAAVLIAAGQAQRDRT